MNASQVGDRTRELLIAIWERRTVKLTVITIGLGLAMAVAWQIAYPSTTWRYRLTVEVEVDGQKYTGSGVYEVIYSRHMKFLPDVRSSSIDLRGEAIVVEVGSKDNLVVLLPGAGSDRYSSSPLSQLSQRVYLQSKRDADISDMPDMIGTRPIPIEQLPAMVMFDDAENPGSYRFIDPAGFSVASGIPAVVTGATIEMVDARVTTGIESRLPFLKDMNWSEPLPGPDLMSAQPLRSLHFYSGTFKDEQG